MSIFHKNPEAYPVLLTHSSLSCRLFLVIYGYCPLHSAGVRYQCMKHVKKRKRETDVTLEMAPAVSVDASLVFAETKVPGAGAIAEADGEE